MLTPLIRAFFLVFVLALPASAVEKAWPKGGATVVISNATSSATGVAAPAWPKTTSAVGINTRTISFYAKDSTFTIGAPTQACYSPFDNTSDDDNDFAKSTCLTITASDNKAYVPSGYQMQFISLKATLAEAIDVGKQLRECFWHLGMDDGGGYSRIPGNLWLFDVNGSAGNVTQGTTATVKLGGLAGYSLSGGSWWTLSVEPYGTGSYCFQVLGTQFELTYALEPEGATLSGISGHPSKRVLTIGDSIALGSQDGTRGAVWHDAMQTTLGSGYAIMRAGCGATGALDWAETTHSQSNEVEGSDTACSIHDYTPDTIWTRRVADHIRGDKTTIVSVGPVGINDANPAGSGESGSSITASAYGDAIQDIADEIIVLCPSCSVVIHKMGQQTGLNTTYKDLLIAYRGEIDTVVASNAKFYAGADILDALGEQASLHPNAAESITMGNAMGAAILAAGL